MTVKFPRECFIFTHIALIVGRSLSLESRRGWDAKFRQDIVAAPALGRYWYERDARVSVDRRAPVVRHTRAARCRHDVPVTCLIDGSCEQLNQSLSHRREQVP